MIDNDKDPVFSEQCFEVAVPRSALMHGPILTLEVCECGRGVASAKKNLEQGAPLSDLAAALA